MTKNQLAVIPIATDFLMPAAPLDVVLAAFQMRKDFIEAVLKVDVDYGTIPGSKKPALYKPGAEKMTSFFGLAPIFEDRKTIEDWTGADHNGEPFFYYHQTCKLYRGDRLIASADGSCNSMETKYRYRWVNEPDVPLDLKNTKLKTQNGRISEFEFAIDKAETNGKYGKPAEYWKSFNDAIANHTATAIKRETRGGKELPAWEIGATLYRIPNTEIADAANTILKMAQKRALVAAVLIATNTSDHFTQDLDDFASQDVVDSVWHDTAPTQPAQPAKQPETTGNNGHAPEVAKQPAPLTKPLLESTNKMSIENAESEFSETSNAVYGALPTATLAQINDGLNKAKRSKPWTDDQARKAEAIRVIMAARSDGRPVWPIKVSPHELGKALARIDPSDGLPFEDK